MTMWQQRVLAKFPVFDPAWPEDVSNQWFDVFEWLLTWHPDDDATRAKTVTTTMLDDITGTVGSIRDQFDHRFTVKPKEVAG